MAFLCISRGNSSEQVIKLKEGNVWEIDQYTLKFDDSTQIREKNATAYRQFRQQYPDSGRGAVRLFKPSHKEEGEWREWIVLYRKHMIAFKKIINNGNFMKYYARIDNKYFSKYYKHEIQRNSLRLKSIMEMFLRDLRRKDGSRSGGEKYYGFVRETIFQYIQYCKNNKFALSVDDLYEEYCTEQDRIEREKHTPVIKLEPEPSPTYMESEDHDPDIDIFEEMDRVEPKVGVLESFISAPDFDRYYGNVFKDDYLFLLGNLNASARTPEIYEKWCEFCEYGFEGTVICPVLSKNGSSAGKFEEAGVVIFCVFESELYLEKQILMALENKSEVAILLFNHSLYHRYLKKFKQARVILAGDELEESASDELGNFFIDAYNNAKSSDKRYVK